MQHSHNSAALFFAARRNHSSIKTIVKGTEERYLESRYLESHFGPEEGNGKAVEDGRSLYIWFSSLSFGLWLRAGRHANENNGGPCSMQSGERPPLCVRPVSLFSRILPIRRLDRTHSAVKQSANCADNRRTLLSFRKKRHPVN
jgi:hypothetical protein